MDLTKIKGPSFLKELTEKELNDLAKDIRQFIIESVFSNRWTFIK